MGTRSDIIVQKADGTWKRIYCHFDGYLSHNGKILFENYNSQKQVEALIELGDLSSLAPKCTKPKGHTFDTAKNDYCVSYSRDRGEHDMLGSTGDTIQSVWPDTYTDTEYTYVWKIDETGGKWWVGNPHEGTQSLTDLNVALAQDLVENA